MRRWALRASLPFALLLLPSPGVAATTCTATASGAWTATGTWSCGGIPGASDAVVIPAGKTVSVAAEETQEAARVTLRGQLALGDASEVDTDGFAGSGGTLSGPQYAMLVVTVDTGLQATVDSAGLTVDGAYLNVTGDGTFGIAGPLALSNGGWVESDIDATWNGRAPWQFGGGEGAPTSGFSMYGAQLAITGATAAQLANDAGDGEIRLEGGATLVKQDATTARLDVDVIIDGAALHVDAGTLVGRFQGAGSLWIAPGATLGLAGSNMQIAPPALAVAGATLEIEPGAAIVLTLPAAPALHRLGLAAGATLEVSIARDIAVATPPDALANEITLGADATLSLAGGAGVLALADHDVLRGSGTIDGSLVNSGGTVSPNGALEITGEYAQGAGGTLALDLRGSRDGDALRVGGPTVLAGTLHVTTGYSPPATAAPVVLAATAKPSGAFSRKLAPLPSGRAWELIYSATGVTLAATASGAAPVSLARPTLRPAVPVVGARMRCMPGTWQAAHALAYQWLRNGRPIPSATTARYRVAPADRGRSLACRVTATATGGSHSAATSKRARAQVGLRIGALTMQPGGRFSLALRCAARERRCTGALRLIVAGRPVAGGRFAVRSPGGEAQLVPMGPRRGHAGARAVVHATYSDGAGAARDVQRSVALTG